MTGASGGAAKFHILLERDVGLFSLVQQVISHIPWAVREGRIPVPAFGRNCVYWTPDGYQGKDSVWEYYFEPVVPGFGVANVPATTMAEARLPAAPGEVYRVLSDGSVVSTHFGDHPSLKGKTLTIPFRWFDPSPRVRRTASPLLKQYARPRGYIVDAAEKFFNEKLAGHPIVGVHARGTDAFAKRRRRGSLVLPNFDSRIDALLAKKPGAKIFLATDEQSNVDYFKARYGDRLVAYPSYRHTDGEAQGRGPLGKIMPGYITKPGTGPRNGEEAVIEYLLLCKCDCIVHNGSGLARTALLAVPSMPHFNVHLEHTPYATILLDLGLTRWRKIRRVKR